MPPSPKARSFGLEQERAELERLLASGIFDRAPSLARFLTYVCEKYFAGEADQVKEYSVAVEALGRPPDFDYTKDSIVRVEAHRLRKRLMQYYSSAGADHEIQIVIPTGGYVPSFVPRRGSRPAVAKTRSRPGAPQEPVNGKAAGDEDARPDAAPSTRTRRGLLAAAGAVAAVAAGGAAFLVLQDRGELEGYRAAGTSAALVAGERAPDSLLRISAGSVAEQAEHYVDGFGRVWDRDRYFTGGEAVETEPPTELNGLPAWPFRSRREGSFTYDIPLPSGTYELLLYFAETRAPPEIAPGDDDVPRHFDVRANGRLLLKSFDVAADAGGIGIVSVKVFTDIVPAGDGYLHLEFSGGGAILSALEIVEGLPGRMRPLRIMAGKKASYYDRLGRFWFGDRYYRGGRTVTRSQLVSGTADPHLYSGERFGAFSYVLPVVPGSYTLRMQFAETWRGPGNPGGGGAGSRVFSVYANGTALLENFDIMQEAGEENRAVEKAFHGIQSNAQGKIVLDFIPVTDDACVNAIELIHEAGAPPG